MLALNTVAEYLVFLVKELYNILAQPMAFSLHLYFTTHIVHKTLCPRGYPGSDVSFPTISEKSADFDLIFSGSDPAVHTVTVESTELTQFSLCLWVRSVSAQGQAKILVLRDVER